MKKLKDINGLDNYGNPKEFTSETILTIWRSQRCKFKDSSAPSAFYELPEFKQKKDALFVAIVNSLR